MISIRGMTKIHQIGKDLHTVFDDVNLDLPTDRHCAILGGPESGKSTLVRILAGAEDPTYGSVLRYANLSFPVGYVRGFRQQMTVRQNIEHAARLYGADAGEVIAFIGEVTGLGTQMDESMRRIHARHRVTLAYALSYAIPFDTYLVDEHIALGLNEFRDVCQAMFAHRARESGILLATHDVRKALTYCDMAAVIFDHKIVLIEDIREAVELFLDHQARQGEGRSGPRPTIQPTRERA